MLGEFTAMLSEELLGPVAVGVKPIVTGMLPRGAIVNGPVGAIENGALKEGIVPLRLPRPRLRRMTRREGVDPTRVAGNLIDVGAESIPA